MDVTIIQPEKQDNGHNELVKFNITDIAIAEMKANYMALKIDGIEDKNGYKVVYNARQIVKNKRILVRKTADELEIPHKEKISAIRQEEKRIIELLNPIEDYLQQRETDYNNEIERIKREAAEKEQKRIQDRINQLSFYGYNVDYSEIRTMTDISFAEVIKLAQIEYNKELEAKRQEQDRIKQLEYENNILKAQQKAEDKLIGHQMKSLVAKNGCDDAAMIKTFATFLGNNLIYPSCKTEQGKKLMKDVKLQIEGIQNYLLKQLKLYSVFENNNGD